VANDGYIERVKAKTRLQVDKLKRKVDYTKFEFETTEQVPELTSIVGQERGRQVMKFGLNVHKIGYNIYVAGIAGTGKTTFTNSIVEEFAKKDVKLYDWCYVYNFEDAYKPKMLKLPAGMGKSLQHDMEQFIEALKADIPRAFNEESYQKERTMIIREYNERSGKVFEELSGIAAEYDFMIRPSGSGILTIPVVEGEPISEEQYRRLDQTELAEIDKKSEKLQDKILNYTNRLREIETEAKETLEELDNKVALSAIGYHMDALVEKYHSCPDVITYLEAVQQDIVEHKSDFLQDDTEQNANPLQLMMRRSDSESFPNKYYINLLVDNSETEGAPVITADNPTFYNLIGKVEYESRMGMMSTDFTKIKPGFLHYANGGYLIIQAKDILSKSFAWDGLKRALLNQQIQIENIGEHSGLVTTTSLDPDPMPLDVKVILIGNINLYQLLYYYDEDFSKLFKVKADFDVEMDHTLENMNRLASFIHTHCKEHNLLHFNRKAVAKIVEHSMRLAGHQEKLSTRFNQQVEIIYEADTWAKLEGANLVTEEHIRKAIKERDYRSNMYEEKIQESIEEGTILIDTKGKKVGQVNGLAVYQLGQYSFGKPTRITATTFVGRRGIVNIERESKMSGNIHNKGVYILSGYLGQQFAQERPLSLTAHIAFEQSYGGVDGDSASSTELYALISSLAEVPIDQGLAVTGSVNQWGEVQPIGGVNEKIEGFFEVCKKQGLTGTQGVLIPHQNVKHLMLKDEVIEAVEAGKFHIYAIETVEEGIALLTGMKAREIEQKDSFGEKTVYQKVADKLHYFIERTKQMNDEKKEDEETNKEDTSKNDEKDITDDEEM